MMSSFLNSSTPRESWSFVAERRNPELFNLAIGGYGLFGVIYAVGLATHAQRKTAKRVVQVVVDIAEVIQLA